MFFDSNPKRVFLSLDTKKVNAYLVGMKIHCIKCKEYINAKPFQKHLYECIGVVKEDAISQRAPKEADQNVSFTPDTLVECISPIVEFKFLL